MQTRLGAPGPDGQGGDGRPLPTMTRSPRSEILRLSAIFILFSRGNSRASPPTLGCLPYSRLKWPSGVGPWGCSLRAGADVGTFLLCTLNLRRPWPYSLSFSVRPCFGFVQARGGFVPPEIYIWVGSQSDETRASVPPRPSLWATQHPLLPCFVACPVVLFCSTPFSFFLLGGLRSKHC